MAPCAFSIKRIFFQITSEKLKSMAIKIEALRTFVHVADAGNIKDAADVLGRTQSAISMTLKLIEERLCGALFETDRKQNLTDLGKHVYQVAVGALRDFDQANANISSYAQGQTGLLRIASVPSVASLLIPEALRDFALASPDAQIELIDTDSTDVQKLVLSGQVDLGIAGIQILNSEMDVKPLFDDRFNIVCLKENALAQMKKPLEWTDLSDCKLIMNETLRGILVPEIQSQLVNSRLSVRNVTSLIAMVQANLGITVLPSLATLYLPSGLVALPVNGPHSTRQVWIMHKESKLRSPISIKFQNHLEVKIKEFAVKYGLELYPN